MATRCISDVEGLLQDLYAFFHAIDGPHPTTRCVCKYLADPSRSMHRITDRHSQYSLLPIFANPSPGLHVVTTHVSAAFSHLPWPASRTVHKVKFMVDTDPVVSPPSPAPTSDFYVGCFNDMMADPVMTNVTVDDALTSEVPKRDLTSSLIETVLVILCKRHTTPM